LAVAGVEGAKERASETFQIAKQYDPSSPVAHLMEAELAIQLDDKAAAREAAERAVVLRNGYTEALFLLAQLDIAEGNTERAIAIVKAITQLEPENPARRYQLGILLASFNQLDDAIVSFEEAVNLDPQYANARYLLALGYAEKGMVDEAIEQLTIVRGLSEGNEMVDELISQLQTTGSINTSLTNQSPVSERSAEDGGVVETDLENDLVTSSNPVPETTNEEIPAGE
jgi:tetratricopeptide (TPR) repeat protein